MLLCPDVDLYRCYDVHTLIGMVLTTVYRCYDVFVLITLYTVYMYIAVYVSMCPYLLHTVYVSVGLCVYMSILFLPVCEIISLEHF
jgi:hypothetical protein